VGALFSLPPDPLPAEPVAGTVPTAEAGVFVMLGSEESEQAAACAHSPKSTRVVDGRLSMASRTTTRLRRAPTKNARFQAQSKLSARLL